MAPETIFWGRGSGEIVDLYHLLLAVFNDSISVSCHLPWLKHGQVTRRIVSLADSCTGACISSRMEA